VTARVVPYHCPYCGEEDLRPYESQSGSDTAARSDSEVEIRGAWHCADCTRVFAVKYHGMAAAPVYAAPPTGDRPE
jgi:transposase-like protein